MNYLITLLFLLLSSSANILSLNDIVWFSILLGMVIYALMKKMILQKDLKILGLFMLVYLVYVILRNLLITNLDSQYLISDLIFPFKYLLLSFAYCVIMREKAMDYLVKVIVHLTLIGFVLYALQLTLGDFIYNFSESLGLPKANTIPGYTNFIIFSFTKGRHDYRNSGFVWEPGAYGCFLILALFFNLLKTKFKFDKVSIILVIGILTTFSTTDYFALLILFFLAYRYRVPKLNLWILIMIPSFVLLIIFVPFLGDKIAGIYTDDMDELKHLHEISIYHLKHNEEIPLNRFSSMSYIWDNVGSGLILGLSNKYDEILNKVYNVNISNGIFDFMAKFGVVGLIFVVYSYAKFCAAFLKKNEYVIYCVLIFLVMSFGEPIVFLPIVLLFLFLPFITDIGKEEDTPENKYGLPDLDR
jgi:hypothetical protein